MDGTVMDQSTCKFLNCGKGV